MKLVKSQVKYDPTTHTYTLGGRVLSGITPVLSRQLFTDKYSNVPEDIMQNAAEKGTAIHEVCELIDDLHITHESPEAKGYVALKDLYGLRYECSEYLVSDNENYASSIDKVYRESVTEFTLGDIKTTYVLDEESVRWQLSIYAYLFELQNPGCKVVRLIGIWLRGETHEIVEVSRIPDDIVINLLAVDSAGGQFNNPIVPNESMPDEFREMEKEIENTLYLADFWAEKKKSLSDMLKKEMTKAGVYKWKSDKFTFTRKKDSVRESFDTKALKEKHPDIYKDFVKESPVAGGVIMKLN